MTKIYEASFNESVFAIRHFDDVDVKVYQDFVDRFIPDYLEPVVERVCTHLDNAYLRIRMIDQPDIIAPDEYWLIGTPGNIKVVDQGYFNAFYEVKISGSIHD